MLLYHGSNVAVEHPDITHSRKAVDFGRGFYATSIEEQAIRWCQRFKRIGSAAILSVYEFTEDTSLDFNIKRFPAYDENWLDFVMGCRQGLDTSCFDIVEGGIANDRVFDTIELYGNGLIGKEAALSRLAFEKPNHQICFRTQRAIDLCLAFVEAHKV